MNDSPQPYAGHHELSDEAKDDIYDWTNQTFHEAAAVWQYVEQGDPQEAEQVLQGIETHIAAIRARIAEFQTDETRLKAAAKSMLGTHPTVSFQIIHPEGTALERDAAMSGEHMARIAQTSCDYMAALKAAYPPDTRFTATHHHSPPFID